MDKNSLWGGNQELDITGRGVGPSLFWRFGWSEPYSICGSAELVGLVGGAELYGIGTSYSIDRAWLHGAFSSVRLTELYGIHG